MAEYTNYLARKVNGPVAQSLLKGVFSFFQDAEDWLNYRSRISLASADTEDLNLIGKIIGVPRPYAIIDEETVYADDDTYRVFLLNVAYLKRSKSITALGVMLSQFVTNGLFEISIKPDGDIRVVVDSTYEAYLPFLEQVGNSVFTASPRLTPFESRVILLFIWDFGLYIKYIQLSDPSVWQWQYDAETQTEITSTSADNRIELSADPEDPDRAVLHLNVPISM